MSILICSPETTEAQNKGCQVILAGQDGKYQTCKVFKDDRCHSCWACLSEYPNLSSVKLPNLVRVGLIARNKGTLYPLRYRLERREVSLNSHCMRLLVFVYEDLSMALRLILSNSSAGIHTYGPRDSLSRVCCTGLAASALSQPRHTVLACALCSQALHSILPQSLVKPENDLANFEERTR